MWMTAYHEAAADKDVLFRHIIRVDDLENVMLPSFAAHTPTSRRPHEDVFAVA